MAKQEFLQELRAALQGEVSQSAINEHLRYYDSYITEEARKGKSEEEVVSMLKPPPDRQDADRHVGAVRAVWRPGEGLSGGKRAGARWDVRRL